MRHLSQLRSYSKLTADGGRKAISFGAVTTGGAHTPVDGPTAHVHKDNKWSRGCLF